MLRLLFVAAALVAARAQDDGDVEDLLVPEPAAERTPSPHLVIAKSVVDEPAVVGNPVTVKLTVYNAGDSTAYGVMLRDIIWQGGLVLPTGAAEPESKVDSLKAGESHTYEYQMVAKSAGIAVGRPAQAMYKTRAGKELASYSHGVQALVISRQAALVNRAVEVGKWVSLGFLRTHEAWRNFIALLVLLGGALGVNASVLKVRAARASHKRRKAEAELLKAK